MLVPELLSFKRLLPLTILLIACGSKDEAPLQDMPPLTATPGDAGMVLPPPMMDPGLTPAPAPTEDAAMPAPAPAPTPPVTPAPSPTCPAMDVRAERPESECGFGNLQGWYWDGGSCQALGGCGCVGADCGGLYADRDTCVAQRQSCTTAPPAASCSPANAQGTGACGDILGWIWNGSSCIPLGGCTCSGADCAMLVPDRATCDAAHASCGSTPAPPPGPPAPPGTCGSVNQACCLSGTACVTGATCISGTCQASSGTPPSGSCGTQFAACCTTGTQCQDNLMCFFGMCMPEFGSDPPPSSSPTTCRGSWTGRMGTCYDQTRTRCNGRSEHGCSGTNMVCCTPY